MHRFCRFSVLLPLALGACEVGPDYKLPDMAMPVAFKEAPKPQAPVPAQPVPELAKKLEKAKPQDDALRGQWWLVFNDATLNKLEEEAAVSNQTVKAAEGSFENARALVAEARAAFFPTAGVSASESRFGEGLGSQATTGANFGSGGKSTKILNSYSITGQASWVPDFWGKIRRELESSKATAQSFAADLASAMLTVQSELAIDYLSLRLADEQNRLLARTVVAYSRSLEITRNQYHAGIAVSSDVLQAETQLEGAQAQMVDVGVQRAQFEHAIAVLTGKPPAGFTLHVVDEVPALPDVPAIVPSELLQRRPDIAGAERTVEAANAQIGVAEAAYFPNITLAADGGFQSASFAQWFTIPSRFWSVGPSLVETVFDAGLRSAQTEAAIATYDQTVANYRQTVLSAFQEVEDNLAALRIYAQEAETVDSEVQHANKAVDVFTNEYKAGTVNYLSVVTAETAALNAQLQALTVRKERLIAAATLIEDLGGGWNKSALDKPDVTQGATTPLSILPPSFHQQ